jgi:hypothetical protein
VHDWGTLEHLEGVQIGSGSFWKVWCRAGLLGRSNRPLVVKCQVGSRTAQCWRFNCPRQSEQDFAPCCIPTLVQGEYALAHGELAYVQEEHFVLFELWIGGLCSLLEHDFVSHVSSRCPCLRGPRLVFFKWSCFLPFFGFWSLVEVSFYSFFLFLFSLVTNHVCCQCTLQGGDWEPCVVPGPVDGRFLVAPWLVLVQVKNKRERSSSVRPPGVEKISGQRSQVRSAWWQEQRDEVVDGFLVEPQNQGQARTTWEPSHDWWLAEATSSSRSLQWFTRKPLGYSVEPQNRGRRLDEEVRPPKPV